MLEVASKISKDNYPRHVAIIMDGNGRWAKSRGLQRTAGHKKGAKTTQDIVRACGELGIEYLTIYAFSSENWNRPQSEIDDLMNLLSFYISHELKTLVKNNIRLNVIGDKERLPEKVRKQVDKAEQSTVDNTGLCLQIALSYGSRQEITHAMKEIAYKVELGEIAAESVGESVIEAHLFTKNVPDPDLLIRTSGEHRISNFLLWQLAYTELFFTEKMWPEFTREDLESAFENFAKRERRYGTA